MQFTAAPQRKGRSGGGTTVGARRCWGPRRQELVQAECSAMLTASEGGWCLLAMSVVFYSEGQRWGDHRRLQNDVEGAGSASWWSGSAVRADLEVGGCWRRLDGLEVTRRDSGGREEFWRQW